jgi:6-pyruvoyltetrahydropterin/6-carboxytetrahydropterin synthase
MWAIDKQFSFCYGHRVWSQQLRKEFCEAGDSSCKCRFLHGHGATVHVFLESDKLERGMVTDFKHLGWLNTFFNKYLDHKFIIDVNDPWFNNIVNLEPTWKPNPMIGGEPYLAGFVPRQPLNTTSEKELDAVPVYANDLHVRPIGYVIDVSKMSGVEREFFEGFFITTFLPTSEHFAQWIYQIVEEKMKPLNVQVSRVDWFETPKSRSSYTRSDK